FFSSRRRHTISKRDWSSDVCSSDLSGSVLLAFLLHFYLHEAISEDVWLFLGIGFCGAYTTFSTFGNETLLLILDKNYKKAVGYVISSIITALLIVRIILYII